jgi:small subunit ribosomal protein S9
MEKKSAEKPKKAKVETKVKEAVAEKPAKSVETVKVATPKAVTDKIPAQSFYGTGKRKSAIAKVWIYKGTGKITINKQPAVDYVKSDLLVTQILRPLKQLSLESSYDCTITCLGGGIVGQVGACQLGIARALLLASSDNRKPLKVEGFLTRDPRVKERKKYGKKRARKGFQFRKR